MTNNHFGKLAALSICVILLAGAIYSSVFAQQTGHGGVPGGNSGSGVPSVFGRTGAVTAANGDYNAAQVTNAAAINAANIFSASQTFSAGAARLTLNDTNNDGHAVYLYDYAGYQTLGSQQAGDAFALYQDSQIIVPSTMAFTWSSSGYLYANGDTDLSRPAAGVVAVGSSSTVGDSSGWIQSSAIGNGATGNTDLRGRVTLVSGGGTYNFTKPYTVAPTCVATDSTTAAAVKVLSTTTTLTLTGTGADVLNYICAD